MKDCSEAWPRETAPQDVAEREAVDAAVAQAIEAISQLDHRIRGKLPGRPVMERYALALSRIDEALGEAVRSLYDGQRGDSGA